MLKFFTVDPIDISQFFPTKHFPTIDDLGHKVTFFPIVEIKFGFLES